MAGDRVRIERHVQAVARLQPLGEEIAVLVNQCVPVVAILDRLRFARGKILLELLRDRGKRIVVRETSAQVSKQSLQSLAGGVERVRIGRANVLRIARFRVKLAAVRELVF